jgi:hypothetical protein
VPLCGWGAGSALSAESPSGKGLRSAADGSLLGVEEDDGGDGFGESCCAQSTALNAINQHNNQQRRMFLFYRWILVWQTGQTAKKYRPLRGRL